MRKLDFAASEQQRHRSDCDDGKSSVFVILLYQGLRFAIVCRKIDTTKPSLVKMRIFLLKL